MVDDRGTTGRLSEETLSEETLSDERLSEETLSDERLARLRSERFGRLPAGGRPAALVELVETVPRRGRPESAISEDQRQALYS